MAKLKHPSQPPLDRLHKLPRFAAVGFAARCALRVLPALSPITDDSSRDQVDEQTAAVIGGLMAMRASVGGVPTDRRVASRLTSAFSKKEQRDHEIAARRCVVTAVIASRAKNSDVSQHVGTCFDAHRAVASHFDVTEAFEAAAVEDLSELERLILRSSGDEPGIDVPRLFFARLLFGPQPDPMPARWSPVFGAWSQALDRLKMGSLHEFYMRLCSGAPIEQDEVVLAVQAWADGKAVLLPRASSPLPAPKRTLTRALPRIVKRVPKAPDPPRVINDPEPPASTNEPDVWMLADRALEGRTPKDFENEDRFKFGDYANALAAILDHEKTETPFTMAINAPWGAGKTTLANMIVAELHARCEREGRDPHVICRFNAWMHDDAPNLATAFISEVTRTADRHRFPFLWILQPIPSAVLTPGSRNLRRLAAALLAATLTIISALWIAGHLGHVEDSTRAEAARTIAFQSTDTVTKDAAGKEVARSASESRAQTRPVSPPPSPGRAPDDVDTALTWLQARVLRFGAFATAFAGLVGLLVKVLASTSLSGFLASPKKAAEAGVIPAAERQLKRLIKQATWRGNRFIVFVDDIERCRPPRSIDVLDAVNQLMDHQNVLVVFLGDMAAVAAAAQLKYKDLSEIYVPSAGIALTGPDRGKEAFGRLYLQKIIQFQFDLPIPPKEKIRDYMGRLAVTAEVKGAANGASAA